MNLQNFRHSSLAGGPIILQTGWPHDPAKNSTRWPHDPANRQGIARSGDKDWRVWRQPSRRPTPRIVWVVEWDRAVKRHRSRRLSPRIAYPGDRANGGGRQATRGWATTHAKRGDRERLVRRLPSRSKSPIPAKISDNDRDAWRHVPQRQATTIVERVALSRVAGRR